MTLNTTLYLHDPVDPHEVFHWCRTHLLGATEEHPWYEGLENAWNRPRRIAIGPRKGETIPARVILTKNAPMHLANEIGIGLDALLELRYRPGVPLRTPEQAADHRVNEVCNHPDNSYYDPQLPTCDGTRHKPACWLQLEFDTGYGYTGPDGEDCSMLHARYLIALGAWLGEKGVDLSWMNEFTGEIHPGGEGLLDFVGSGERSKNWFLNVAMPLIKEHAATGAQGPAAAEKNSACTEDD